MRNGENGQNILKVLKILGTWRKRCCILNGSHNFEGREGRSWEPGSRTLGG